MKALVLHGKNEPLQYQDVPDPVAENDRAVVRLKAAALNHRDAWIQKGQYAGLRFPIIPGSDGAGLLGDRAVVINPSLNWHGSLPTQPKDYKILGLPDDGTFAEQVVVDEKNIYDKPAHLTFAEAAALPLAGLTAFRVLFTRCQVRAGENVLISGVGGGVALFACQFAIAAGARVYVTSGSDDKIERAVALGALGGANYRDEDWVKRLTATSGPFDVIIDSAAGEGFMNLLKAAAPAARIGSYGGTLGNIPLNPQMLFWKQISILGSTMGHDGEFAEMLDLVNRHRIQPVVDSIFPLPAGNSALERMNGGLQFGKIVLEISN